MEFRPVHPRWIAAYPVQAYSWYRVAPEDLRIVQVVFPDAAGRLPRDPDVDPAWLRVMPDLRDPDLPWPAVRQLADETIMAETEPHGADTMVLLPITADE